MAVGVVVREESTLKKSIFFFNLDDIDDNSSNFHDGGLRRAPEAFCPDLVQFQEQGEPG